MQDPERRVYAVPYFSSNMNGTGTEGGHAGHWKGKRQDRVTDPAKMVIDLKWLAPAIPLYEAHDQLGGLGGKFCYVYV